MNPITNTSLLISLPKLTAIGGVSSYWNTLLPYLKTLQPLETIEVGGHGNNPFGAIKDQWNFHQKLKKVSPKMVILNPSLGFNSFFRDGLFATSLARQEIPFIPFFHGWNEAFALRVTQHHQPFFLKSYAKAKQILVLSEEAKKTIQSWGYQGEVSIETTTIEPTLIKDFSLSNKNYPKNPNEPIKILFLSRLLKEKGIYELLDAFKELAVHFSKLELQIVGDGAILHQLKQAHASYPNIHWMGYQTGNAKAQLLSQADIYVLPSYSEGLPISLLEAMAFGLPIITTPVGGLRSFFQEEKMGYFVPPFQVQPLIKQLKKLILQPELREKMGHFNHHYTQTHLINSVVAQRINHYINKEITYATASRSTSI